MTEVVMGNVAFYKKRIEELEATVTKLRRELHDARSDLGYANDEIRERIEREEYSRGGHGW